MLIEREFGKLMKHTRFIETTLGLIGISEIDGLITEIFLEKDTQKKRRRRANFGVEGS